MKLRNLLPILLLGASLSASASFPLKFRDAVNSAVDGGGHMEFPVVDGTKTDTYYGDPLFNEDGSITATSNALATGGAAYIRTVKLTEDCPEEYTVLAFEYKTNRPISNLVIWKHEIANTHNIFDGALMTVSDDYQTLYAPLDRNEGWGKVGNYLWINTNDPNKSEGWEFTIKNIRLLSMEEATEECKNAPVAGSYIEDNFSLPNGDFTKDFDSEMDGGCDIYVKNGGNPIFQSGNLIKPLPNGYTTFCFDYKLTGTSYAPKVYLHKKSDFTAMTGAPLPEGLVLEGTPEEEIYTTPWKTFSIDLSQKIEEIGFAQQFGSNHFLWVQNMELGEDQMLYIKNVRWVNPNATGIDEITYTPERPADNRIFNLMGIECKGDLAPGIYIQNGKKFIVK